MEKIRKILRVCYFIVYDNLILRNKYNETCENLLNLLLVIKYLNLFNKYI